MREAVHFSGIVVTYNEARHLHACLSSLSFCRQLIVIDLGSKDDSADIARKYGATVLQYKRVPLVEQIWPQVVPMTEFSWIVRADPDEVISSNLVDDVCSAIQSPNSGSIACFAIPHQYYFRGRALQTTSWGQTQYVRKIFHKERVHLNPTVHRGIVLKPGFVEHKIERKRDNIVQHYWVDSYLQLFEKHWRYIKHEGESRYHFGQRFSWRRWQYNTRRTLRQNLFNEQGIKGGATGIFLSFFRAAYECLSLLSLYQYQKSKKRNS